MDDERLYTTKEAAEILGLAEYTVRKKIRDGEIEAILGSSAREGHRIKGEKLEKYIKTHDRYGKGYIKSITEKTSGFGATVASSMIMPLPLLASPLLGALGVLGGVLSDVTEKNNKPESNYDWIKDERIVNLRLEQLNDEIEAFKYSIELVELNYKENENISTEDKKKILEYKTQIKILENNVKEIEIRRALLDRKENDK